MILLIVLVILWASYLVPKLLRAQPARIPDLAHPQQPDAVPPAGIHSHVFSQAVPTWSALDDRQLTRLLIDSAPGTTTD